MTRSRESRDEAHFQRIYAANPDPWQFRTSDYEQAKYRRTIESLGERRFRCGFEAGCSIGVLTRMLATHCEALLAADFIESALAAAQERCADQPWVRFARMRLPREWPDGDFDLIVWSEVLYFLLPADIETAADRSAAALVPGGVALLVNWRGRTDDPCSGDEAAEHFIERARASMTVEAHCEEQAYRIDVLRRT
jgi:SAM-dependent methyltransferase